MPFVSKAVRILQGTFSPSALELLRGSQMALGRHQKALEVHTLALEEARVAQAQCEQLVGEQLADEVDTTDAVAQLQAAESRVKTLEHAVNAARRRIGEAKVSIKASEQQAKEEQRRVCLTQLAEAGAATQAAMDVLAECSVKLTKRMNSVLELRNDQDNIKITNARLSFKTRLLATSPSMPGCQTPEHWFLKAEPWAESLPKPTDANEAAP